MKIDLCNIPVLWYGGIKPNRVKQLELFFTKYNIAAKHIPTFVDPSGLTRIGCGKSHLMALNEALKVDGPVLILEDDISETQFFKTQFEIPDQTDAFYVGTCLNGISPYWEHLGAEGGCCANPIALEKHDWYYKIYGMLTTHAILYCSQKYKQFCIDLIARYDYSRHIDVLFAAHMNLHNVYAPKKPLLYQNCPVDNPDAYHKTITPLEVILH
jgi:GR25 family glycosyltransferase involved in LPS biosynthesis